jgi:NAD(P)-dependent dehydrogenase (short-subunit alcohol dehydrogenase family)
MEQFRRFADRVAIVTGASNGIGLATAQRFALEGARVTLADRHKEKLAPAAQKALASGAPAVWASCCDVSSEEQVEATVTGTLERFGHLDVIVNNAGMVVFKPLVSLSQDDWLGMLAVDLLGAFFFIKQAFRRMNAQGAIVNVSSIHAFQTVPLVASYAASKAALLSLTRSAAIEGQPLGIRVNAILAGAVEAPAPWEGSNVVPAKERFETSEIGRVEEIAGAIAFLASEDARFVQGAAMRVDGGRLCRL